MRGRYALNGRVRGHGYSLTVGICACCHFIKDDMPWKLRRLPTGRQLSDYPLQDCPSSGRPIERASKLLPSQIRMRFSGAAPSVRKSKCVGQAIFQRRQNLRGCSRSDDVSIKRQVDRDLILHIKRSSLYFVVSLSCPTSFAPKPLLFHTAGIFLSL